MTTQSCEPLDAATPFVLTGSASSAHTESVGGTAAPVAPAPARPGQRIDFPDLLARALIVGLFLGLAYRVGQDALINGRPTGLLLLVSELLVAVLTLVRRPATDIDRRWRTRVIAGLSLAGPFLLTPTVAGGPAIEMATATVSAIGLAIVVAAKMSLGRSFGLLPANRGIVSSGLYRVVRHPIYLGYLFTHAAFLTANLSWWNVVALATADAALLVRSAYEEDTLLRDSAYAQYRTRVKWRVLPGVL